MGGEVDSKRQNEKDEDYEIVRERIRTFAKQCGWSSFADIEGKLKGSSLLHIYIINTAEAIAATIALQLKHHVEIVDGCRKICIRVLNPPTIEDLRAAVSKKHS